MSWFKTPKIFTAKTTAKAAEVDENFEKIEEAFNGLFTYGVVSASEFIGLSSTSWVGVPGASVALSPTIPSKVLVVANFDFTVNAASGTQAAYGSISVDSGEPDSHTAILFSKALKIGETVEPRATVSQVYVVGLTAGAHTIALRAKGLSAVAGITVNETSTRLLYLMLPEP